MGKYGTFSDPSYIETKNDFLRAIANELAEANEIGKEANRLNRADLQRKYATYSTGSDGFKHRDSDEELEDNA